MHRPRSKQLRILRSLILCFLFASAAVKAQNVDSIGSYVTTDNAYDVCVSGNYAYVATYRDGLQIINVSNPSSPALVGSFDTPGRAYKVAVLGNHVYLGDYISGLQIIDVSNPATPTLAGSYDTPGLAYGVFVSGD